MMCNASRSSIPLSVPVPELSPQLFLQRRFRSEADTGRSGNCRSIKLRVGDTIALLAVMRLRFQRITETQGSITMTQQVSAATKRPRALECDGRMHVLKAP